MSRFLEMMNPQQQEGVLSVDGPVLLLAGAGSGKTRVITHRIAYLIQERGVPADSILAVTFTNKAAKEMAERVDKILGHSSLAKPVLATFHSFCVRVLRRDLGDADVVMLVNESVRDAVRATAVLPRAGEVVAFDAVDGILTAVPAATDATSTSVDLDLGPGEAIVLLAGAPAAWEGLPVRGAAQHGAAVELSPTWSVGTKTAEQDAFALNSQKKAAAARSNGNFKDEIVEINGVTEDGCEIFTLSPKGLHQPPYAA